MSGASDEDRTHDPTPLRREKFRQEGRFPKSRDAGGLAAAAAVLAVLLGSRAAVSHAVTLLFTSAHGDLSALARPGGQRVLHAAVGAFLALAAPAAVAAAVASAVVGVAQAGFRVNTDALGFKFERLDPIGRLKDLFSLRRGGGEAAVGLLRVGLVGYVSWGALHRELPGLLSLSRVPVDAAWDGVSRALVRVGLDALGTLVLVAGVDYAWSWWSLEREMKMSRKELLEEQKAQEGDPKAKGRLRSRARALARKRSLANVRKADVVVTNPTHIAVALRYAPGDAAPLVVAKGHDELALQLRAEARRHGIPILENRPLARALDAEVPLGRPVPGRHFAAVARVLAWVYRVRPSARRVRPPGP
ncbi:MAG: EscU/YscU/HrcU family type III secretion system export apparatus switch protein [Deltaproteobacteria bacterium]|nr:EscU/YscU/HrcU family type III secretion system export apparatus switch protein [Deltaproteobacteria bacterium]